MKKVLLLIIALFLIICCKKSEIKSENSFRDGDIIFQISTSAQSKAIQLATHSEYSHCGILYNDNNKWYVFEAVQPVKKTPIQEWIKRGKDQHYIIKRLKDSTALTPTRFRKMTALAKTMNGKNYDLYFEWSDDLIYCSELIWKLYKESTGLEIGKLKQLKDFDLSSPIVRQKLKERYGNNIPLDEKVISPKDIYDSELLETAIVK